jgi:hypothetical protein
MMFRRQSMMRQLNDTAASGGKGEQCHWHADQGIDMVSAKFCGSLRLDHQ